MMKILTLFTFVLILAVPATAANVTIVEFHGVVFDEKSKSIILHCSGTPRNSLVSGTTLMAENPARRSQ